VEEEIQGEMQEVEVLAPSHPTVLVGMNPIGMKKTGNKPGDKIMYAISNIAQRICVFGAVLALAAGVHADNLSVPNTFSAGSKAVAAEVNENFSAVSAAVNDNDSRIAALEAALSTLQNTVNAQAATIASLQEQLAVVNDSEVMKLEDYIAVGSDTRGPLVQFSGVNLQLVNGQGATNTINGLGNFIIGYDEADSSGNGHCNSGTNPSDNSKLLDQSTCTRAGFHWSTSGFKTGSHYLVLGTENNYSSYGGLVAGWRNTSSYDLAAVTGGTGNLAAGLTSSVGGGESNTASGDFSSISGGSTNSAAQNWSSVSGGLSNSATGTASSISGGYSNTSSGTLSSVSGGSTNYAGGGYASISGGYHGATSATYTSISGGAGNTIDGDYASISGGADNYVGGDYGSISGGQLNAVGGDFASVLGGYSESANTDLKTVPALP